MPTKRTTPGDNLPVPVEVVERRILSIRDRKVMLDRDLAELYGVKPIALRQQVKRNKNRFPPDFLFQLTKQEAEALVSQTVIPSRRSFGGSLPYAFTEQGVAMLSSVLTSERAIQVNIAIMRAFVKLSTQRDLIRKLEEMEKKYAAHDAQIKTVFQVLKKLIEPPKPPESPKPRIGFITGDK